MTTKIKIKVGGVEVDYEGPEAFLNKKLPELITQLSSLAKKVPAGDDRDGGGGGTGGSEGGAAGTLASFLKVKKAGANQNKRYLATAEWLHRKGSERVQTSEVTKALRDNHQTKLGNASQCLNSNVSSGYCEKVGKEFFVTNDGRDSLG